MSATPSAYSTTSAAFGGPIISAQSLQALLADERPVVVFDCSFDLMQPDLGHSQYCQAHVPGALYAHLDTDLSDKSASGSLKASGGRHPLPNREAVAQWLGRMGVNADTLVVTYDRNANMVSGRLWWMLQWCGHPHAAVLDGGWQQWLAIGGATAAGPVVPRPPATFELRPPRVQLSRVEEVAANLGRPGQLLIDARAPARFRGEMEPLDPAAGHIPGALNRPFGDNFDANGCYKSNDLLKREFSELLGVRDPATVVLHCGSGVSAVPNLIAMTLAGYPTPALFAGSWSEWCSDPQRPVAQG